jgi:ribosome-binding ATPase YchF (GTP1/OBG family)
MKMLRLLFFCRSRGYTELESYEERQVLEDMGLTEPGASVLIRAAYKLLKQQTYFTAGKRGSCLDNRCYQLPHKRQE